MHYTNRIKEIDEDSQIVVCASGRASTYLTTFALLLGLHIPRRLGGFRLEMAHTGREDQNNLETYLAASRWWSFLGGRSSPPMSGGSS